MVVAVLLMLQAFCAATTSSSSDPGTEWVETMGGPRYDYTYSIAASRASTSTTPEGVDTSGGGEVYVVGHFLSGVGVMGNVSKRNLGLYDVSLWKVGMCNRL